MKQFNQDNMKSISDYINNFYEDNPFTKHLGVDIVSIDKGNVCVSLTIKHEHTNVYGIAHGGVIMSLCDMAMGAACLSVVQKQIHGINYMLHAVVAVCNKLFRCNTPRGDKLRHAAHPQAPAAAADTLNGFIAVAEAPRRRVNLKRQAAEVRA